jgi:histone H3/H4
MLFILSFNLDKALREIRILQRVTNLLMSRLFFQRVVKDIMQKQKLTKEKHLEELRIQKNALNALQKAAKELFVKIFENKLQCYLSLSFEMFILMRLMTNLLTIHAKRVIIQVKNMQLFNNLRHSMTNFDTLY